MSDYVVQDDDDAKKHRHLSSANPDLVSRISFLLTYSTKNKAHVDTRLWAHLHHDQHLTIERDE